MRLTSTTSGLETLANLCATWADDVAASAGTGTPGPPWQASSTAVAAIHSRVAHSAASLSARMTANAEALRAAAAAYWAREVQSAAEIAGPDR